MTQQGLAIAGSLVSSVAFGASDFVGGLLSARLDPRLVACIATAATAALIGPVALGTGSTMTAAAWGAAATAGAAGAIGGVFLFRGLSRGRMGVVAPISGLVTALLPMMVGALRGEAHSTLAWAGLFVAGPAIVLIAKGTGPVDRPSGWYAGVIAGLGFGTNFALLATMSSAVFLAALTMAQAISAALLGATCIAARVTVPRSDWADGARSVACGLLGGLGLVTFQLAARHGHLGESAVISSFYPATTVVLATVVLGEQLMRPQVVGFCICAISVGLIVLG